MSNLSYFQQFGLGGGNNAASTNNRCVIYTRVSTTGQEDNTSLGNQAETCRKFAEYNGYQIVEEFGGKGESAKSGSARKEYERMMKFVRKKSNKIRFVVFYSYDRFSREGGKAIVDKDQLRQMGIHIKSATLPIDTDTPMGSAMEDFQLILSKVDNDMRRSKCIAGMQSKLRAGHWCGQAPTGYRWNKYNGELELDPVAAPLIKKAFIWKHKDPNVTSEEIRRKLAKMGLKVSPATMTRIYRNPFYCGMIVHKQLNGDVVEGKHPKIISQKVFLEVNNVVMDQNNHGWQVHEENDNLPLKKFMRCECCGTPLTGYVVKSKGIHYYKCRKKGCSINKNAKQLESLFLEELNQFSVQEEAVPFIAQQIRATIVELNEAQFKEIEAMERRHHEIDKKLKRLKARFILEEAITREEYTEFSQMLNEEKEQIQKELSQAQRNSSNHLEKLEECIKIMGDLNVLWENGDYRDKQRVQKIAFPEGMTYDKKSDRVRTPRVNELFRVSSQLSQIIAQNGTGNFNENSKDFSWLHPPKFKPQLHYFTKSGSQRQFFTLQLHNNMRDSLILPDESGSVPVLP